MLTHFSKITNDLISQCKPIFNGNKVRKIIRSLLKSLDVKATSLKELNVSKEMDFMVFMGNIKTNEMEFMTRKE